MENILVFFRNLSSQKFIKDTLYNYISTIIMGLSGLTLNIIIGNHFGAEGLGVFNQSMAIFLLLSIVSVLGLQSSVVKYAAEFSNEPAELNYLMSAAIKISLSFSVILSLGLICLCQIAPSFFFNADVTKATQWVLLSIPFFTLNKLLMGLLNGLREMKAVAIIQAFRWLMIFFIVFLCILFKLPIYLTLLSITITEMFLSFLLLVYTNRFFKFSFTNNKVWNNKHFKFGSKTLPISVVDEANNNTDIFLIGIFLGNYYVGLYSFAVSIVKGILMFPGIVQVNINPIVSNLWGKSQTQQIDIYVGRIKKTMLILVIPTMLIAAISYPVFINIFMSQSDFKDSIIIFYILLGGIILPFIFNFASGFLAMANLLNSAMILILSSLCVNVLANMILIHIFSIYGAAVALCITYTFTVLFMRYLIKKKMGISSF